MLEHLSRLFENQPIIVLVFFPLVVVSVVLGYLAIKLISRKFDDPPAVNNEVSLQFDAATPTAQLLPEPDPPKRSSMPGFSYYVPAHPKRGTVPLNELFEIINELSNRREARAFSVCGYALKGLSPQKVVSVADRRQFFAQHEDLIRHFSTKAQTPCSTGMLAAFANCVIAGHVSFADAVLAVNEIRDLEIKRPKPRQFTSDNPFVLLRHALLEHPSDMHYALTLEAIVLRFNALKMHRNAIEPAKVDVDTTDRFPSVIGG
jgi:hypothetical protein